MVVVVAPLQTLPMGQVAEAVRHEGVDDPNNVKSKARNAILQMPTLGQDLNIPVSPIDQTKEAI